MADSDDFPEPPNFATTLSETEKGAVASVTQLDDENVDEKAALTDENFATKTEEEPSQE